MLAGAVIFTFCSKPEMAEELAASVPTPVSDRATCTITNLQPVNTAELSFCGVGPIGEPCLTCNNTLSNAGSIVFAPGVPVNFTVNSPVTFSLRANKKTSVNLQSNGQGPGWIIIEAGECVSYTVDDNCNLTLSKQ